MTIEGILLTIVVLAIGIALSCWHDEQKASGKITAGDNSLRLARLVNQLLDIMIKYEGGRIVRSEYCWACRKDIASSGYFIYYDKFEQLLSELKTSRFSEQDKAKYEALKAEYYAAKERQDIYDAKHYVPGRSKALNQALSGADIRGFSSQAKASLAKDAAKEARRKVVKGAVAGGLVAGEAGAVVGAVAAKAKLDAGQAGAGGAAGKDAAKQVVKGAVVGAAIAGDTGAIVGATAARAKSAAENSHT